MINLLPPEIKQEVKNANLQKQVFWYGGSLLMFILLSIGLQFLAYLYVNQQKNDLVQKIENKEKQLSEIDESQEIAKKLSADINKVGALLDRQIDFSTLIQEIGSVLPAATTLNNLSLGIDNTKALNMQFEIDTQEKAAIVRKNLEDSRLFIGADILDIAAKNTDGQGNPSSYSTTIVTKFSEDYLDSLGDPIPKTESTDITTNTNGSFEPNLDASIPIEVTDISSGFLFLKTHKAKITWSTPEGINLQTGSVEYVALARKNLDPDINNPDTKILDLSDQSTEAEFILDSNPKEYNYQICAVKEIDGTKVCVADSIIAVIK